LKRYLAKRLLIAVPSLLIASLIVFTLPRLLPGDAVQLMLAEKAYAKDVDELRAKLGLDRPLAVQYVEWLGRVTRGDLGESLWTRRPVLQELGQRLPVTLELAFFALAFALAIAVPVGVISAARADTIQDYVARSVAILGLSVPGFWLATLLIVLPAIWWGWRPVAQFTEFGTNPLAHITQFLLPALILTSLFFTHTLDFVLKPVYIAALFGTALAIYQTTQDGEATIFEGAALVAGFVVLAAVTLYE